MQMHLASNKPTQPAVLWVMSLQLCSPPKRCLCAPTCVPFPISPLFACTATYLHTFDTRRMTRDWFGCFATSWTITEHRWARYKLDWCKILLFKELLQKYISVVFLRIWKSHVKHKQKTRLRVIEGCIGSAQPCSNLRLSRSFIQKYCIVLQHVLFHASSGTSSAFRLLEAQFHCSWCCSVACMRF